jgi:hypothetical protein
MFLTDTGTRVQTTTLYSSVDFISSAVGQNQSNNSRFHPNIQTLSFFLHMTLWYFGALTGPGKEMEIPDAAELVNWLKQAGLST